MLFIFCSVRTRILVALLGFLILVTGSIAKANSPDINLSFGHDSNPLRLNDAFKPTGGKYRKFTGTWRKKYDYGGYIYLYFYNKDYLYNPDETLQLNSKTAAPIIDSGTGRALTNPINTEDAGSTTARARYRYTKELKKTKKGRTEISTELTYGMRDKTYYSRKRGRLGTYTLRRQGMDPVVFSIEDRYDYKYLESISALQYPVTKKLQADFSIRFQDRNYHDYSYLPISDLSYKQYDFQIDSTYRFNKKNRLEFDMLLFRQRDFDSRKAHLNRDKILSYSRQAFRSKYSYKYSKKLDLDFFVEYGERRDNDDGHYDVDLHVERFTVTYSPKKNDELEFSVYHRSVEYPNRNQEFDPDSDDEDYAQEEGITWGIKYEKRIHPQKDINLHITYRNIERDSNIFYYAYENQNFELGIKFPLIP